MRRWQAAGDERTRLRWSRGVALASPSPLPPPPSNAALRLRNTPRSAAAATETSAASRSFRAPPPPPAPSRPRHRLCRRPASLLHPPHEVATPPAAAPARASARPPLPSSFLLHPSSSHRSLLDLLMDGAHGSSSPPHPTRGWLDGASSPPPLLHVGRPTARPADAQARPADAQGGGGRGRMGTELRERHHADDSNRTQYAKARRATTRPPLAVCRCRLRPVAGFGSRLSHTPGTRTLVSPGSSARGGRKQSPGHR